MRHLQILMLALASLAVSAAASAQMSSSTTGAMRGRATDATGAPVAGVTVTIVSPSLMGEQKAVTKDDGYFRFPALPPGPYGALFEHPSFKPVVRPAIRVGLGLTATANATMQSAEVIQLTGASTALDVQSTRTGTSIDQSQMANLPSARDLWSGVLGQTAAVQLARIDVGGSAAGTQTGYSAYDYKGGQNRPSLDGMNITEGTGSALFYYDYGSFAEISASTAAHSAEMGTPGVLTMFVGKTGGNTYHGNIYADYQNEKIQSTNVDTKQIALGFSGGGGLKPEDINRMHSYRETRGDIGGYIVKDKLWWFGSARKQDVSQRWPNFPVKPLATGLTAYVGKSTYALSKNNKLIGYYHGGGKSQPNRLDTQLLGSSVVIHESEESTWKQEYYAWVYKGEWNSVLSDRMFFEVRGGQSGANWHNYPYTSKPSYTDLGTSKAWGANRDWGQNIRRNQALGSLTLFAEPHSLKFGFDVFQETIESLRGNEGDYYPGNFAMVLTNGAPAEVYLYGSPSTSLGLLWTFSGYASDIWRVSDKLTLNPGVRYDRYDSRLPEQDHPAGRFTPTATHFPASNVLVWNLVAPRFGATYDVKGNGKTVLKLNYAQYWWNPGYTMGENVNPNPKDWYTRYAWSDTNKDGLWEDGEQGRVIETRGAGAGEILDPNLKDTYTREVAVWFERELIKDFALRTGLVWRGVRQKYERWDANQPFDAFNVPVSIPDPGPDGKVGNADDGPSLNGFNLSPNLVGLKSRNVTANRPAQDDYYTWEATGTKRMSNRWSLSATFTYRLNQDNGTTYYGNKVRDDENPRNPNELINTTDGRYVFTTWSGKLSGTLDSKWWGLRFTPTLRHQSGQPYGRFFLARLNYGNAVRILAEPMDTHRQDNMTLLDIRVEKGITVGSRRLGLFFDVYNITNANPSQNISWSSGSSYLRPNSILSPRIARFGMKFDW